MITPVWVDNFESLVRNPDDFQTRLPKPQSPYGMQAIIGLVSTVFAYAVFRLNKSVGLAVGLLGAVIAILYKTPYQHAVDQYIDPIIEGLNNLHLRHVDWIYDNIDMNKSYSQEEVEEEINQLDENYWADQWTELEGKIGDLAGDSLYIDYINELNDPYLQSKIYELQRMALKLMYGTNSHFSNFNVNATPLEILGTALALSTPNHSIPVRPVLAGNRLIRIESWDD